MDRGDVRHERPRTRKWPPGLPIALVMVVAAASLSGAEPGLLEFLRSRRDRRFEDVPREVLAFYYTWYGRPERHGRWIHWGRVDPDRHEISESTHYPARGAYDSQDPKVVDEHIDLARKHGLTGFIASWWGRANFEDRALQLLMDRAAQKGFKISVYWEVAPGEGAARTDQAVEDLLYLLRSYGVRKPFLKVNGSPVVFVYGRVMDQIPPASWPEVIRRTRAAFGRDFLLIADGYTEFHARLFDGVHTYNICDWVLDRSPAELTKLSRSSYEDAVKLARRQGKISCLTVIPGYDDTKIRRPGLRAARRDGRTYEVLWEQAIAADPDWVLITSWNEWHEGSEIEPSREHGDKYLHVTGEHATRFRVEPRSTSLAGLEGAGPSPAVAAELRALYEGRPIGILPGSHGDLVYWALDAGIELRELGWEDLLDAERFNASKLPLTIHAGDERYVKSVEEEGDVVRSLRRYLREGGLILVLPTLPHPFYYDETGRVDVAAGRVGIPLHGSGPPRRGTAADPRVQPWETPPADRALTFQVDVKRLPGLVGSAPFPTAGDLRWRPATATVLGPDDLYLPLATLRDEHGHDYGDAIAYAEHRTGDLAGGKSLYVWMRMPDVLDPDALYRALLVFGAGKMREPRSR